MTLWYLKKIFKNYPLVPPLLFFLQLFLSQDLKSPVLRVLIIHINISNMKLKQKKTKKKVLQ